MIILVWSSFPFFTKLYACLCFLDLLTQLYICNKPPCTSSTIYFEASGNSYIKFDFCVLIFFFLFYYYYLYCSWSMIENRIVLSSISILIVAILRSLLYMKFLMFLFSYCTRRIKNVFFWNIYIFYDFLFLFNLFYILMTFVLEYHKAWSSTRKCPEKTENKYFENIDIIMHIIIIIQHNTT